MALATEPRIGALIREWRQRRRLSQLDLALSAGVSARHLSFVETGRSKPSRSMVLHLAEHLEVPLRTRNQLLLAAGYAPVYAQRGLDEPEMEPVRDAIEAVLAGHEPNPAVVLDRHFGMLAANRAIAPLIEGSDPALLEPPVNVMRLALHPDGMAPRIVNLAEWRAHLLERLGREAALSGDPALAALYDELAAYPGAGPAPPPVDVEAGQIAVPLRIEHSGGVLSFISTLTTFATANDVTLAELAIESFFPTDAHTAAHLRRLPLG